MVVITGLSAISPARKFPRRKKRCNRPVQWHRIITRRAARTAAHKAPKRHPAADPPTMSRGRFRPELGTGRQVPAPHTKGIKHDREGRFISPQQGVGDRLIGRLGQTRLHCAADSGNMLSDSNPSIGSPFSQKNLSLLFKCRDIYISTQVNKCQSNPTFFPSTA